MKKTLFLTLLVAFCLTLVIKPQQAHAQRMKPWTWKSYKVKFKLPYNWKVKKSSGYVFIAKGPDDVTIKIKPLTYIKDARGAAKYGFNTYSVVKQRKIISQNSMSRDRSGLKRYIIFGEGKSSRTYSPIYCGIIGLWNPATGKTMYVRFWWFKKYDHKYRNITYKIAKSFKAMRAW